MVPPTDKKKTMNIIFMVDLHDPPKKDDLYESSSTLSDSASIS